jgi:hypothetical protein
MADAVGRIPAFVYGQGALAEEIIFRDIDAHGEVPGITPSERRAMAAAAPTVKETTRAVLAACREALWRRAANHPCSEALRKRPTADTVMADEGEVHLPLTPDGTALCGIALTAWGEPTYRLYLWIWVHPAARPRLAEAGRPVPETLDYAEPGAYTRTLDAPHEGERYTEIGARVADALWEMAGPTAALLLPPARRRKS